MVVINLEPQLLGRMRQEDPTLLGSLASSNSASLKVKT